MIAYESVCFIDLYVKADGEFMEIVVKGTGKGADVDSVFFGKGSSLGDPINFEVFWVADWA